MWLLKQTCIPYVAARANHDYKSQDVTIGAMMFLQEQDVAAGVFNSRSLRAALLYIFFARSQF